MQYKVESIIRTPRDNETNRLRVTMLQIPNLIDRIFGKKEEQLVFEGSLGVWNLYPSGKRPPIHLSHIIDEGVEGSRMQNKFCFTK